MRKAYVLSALMLLWALPATAAEAQESDSESTTTTVEIETSATSITSSTAAADEPPAETAEDDTDDTLPFTGAPSSSDLAGVAYVALAAGIVLVTMSRHGDEEEESATSVD